jgi:hypothetical protein
VTTQRACKGILHAAILCHFFGDSGSHEKFDGKQLGLFAKGVLWRVLGEQGLPCVNVGRIIVWLNLSPSEPNGMAVWHFWVGETVAIRSHDTSDWSVNVLVGSVGERSQAGLNGESCNDAIISKEQAITIKLVLILQSGQKGAATLVCVWILTCRFEGQFFHSQLLHGDSWEQT